MKKQVLTLFVICSLSNVFAFAAEQGAGMQNIRFEELKEVCSNPSKFHNQTAPASIQVSCGEMKTKWVPNPQTNVSLPTRRQVVTSVISNKYSVSPYAVEVASDPQLVTCGQYKEITESIETIQNLSCDQILSFKGTGEEYCSVALKSMRVENPLAIKGQDTGKTVDFCNFRMQE